jgi:hypothetical protein
MTRRKQKSSKKPKTNIENGVLDAIIEKLTPIEWLFFHHNRKFSIFNWGEYNEDYDGYMDSSHIAMVTIKDVIRNIQNSNKKDTDPEDLFENININLDNFKFVIDLLWKADVFVIELYIKKESPLIIKTVHHINDKDKEIYFIL